ncbi:3'-5' exonuclease [Arthrobacter sp. KNU40]|uniref:3'-5' exonuclease n=1 Tax=Arthrobacter sp. KNU40 TaxID=3447965 RepID=UPI003F5DB5F9
MSGQRSSTQTNQPGPATSTASPTTTSATPPRFKDVLPDIVQQLAGTTVVAHNADFDLGFLRSEFHRAGTALPDWPSLCTMQLSKRYFPGQRASLADICKRLDIEIGEAHTAAADAVAAARLLSKYIESEMQHDAGAQGQCGS